MKLLLIALLLLGALAVKGQTYKGRSTDGYYSYRLLIHKDSTIALSYFTKDNTCYADFSGTIRHVKDSVYQLSCTSVFDQYLMKNFYDPDICITIDSSAAQARQIKYIRVYSAGLCDSTFYLKNFKAKSKALDKVNYLIPNLCGSADFS